MIQDLKPEEERSAQDPASAFDEQLVEREAWHRYTKYPYLLAKGVFIASLFYLVYLIITSLESVLFPLFLSLLLAYLLDPVIDRFEERRLSRTVGIGIVIMVLAIAFGGFIAFLYPLIASQVVTVVEKLPGLVDVLEKDTIPWLKREFNYEIPPTVSEVISRYGGELKSAAPAIVRRVVEWGATLATQTTTVMIALLNLIMIPIFTFYFLRDFDKMKRSVAAFIPIYLYDRTISRLTRVDEVVGAWFRGQVQVALILAVMYGLGLGLAFGLSGHSVFDGIALGVLSGVLNVIPYVGFAVGFVLSTLVVLLEWTGLGALIGVMVVFGVVQGLEGYVITPKIVGEKVGLSPVTVIIVLLLGGEMAGLIGILLAIPVAGAIKVILPDLAAFYRHTVYYTGSEQPAAQAMISHLEHPRYDMVLKQDDPEADAIEAAQATAALGPTGVASSLPEAKEDA